MMCWCACACAYLSVCPLSCMCVCASKHVWMCACAYLYVFRHFCWNILQEYFVKYDKQGFRTEVFYLISMFTREMR